MNRPASRRGPWWAASDHPDTPSKRACVICGTPIEPDLIEDPLAAAGSMCGDCARAREFDQTLWEMDLSEPDDGLW